MLAGHLKSVEETSDADGPCKLGLGLGYSREKGGEIVYCVDVIFLHDIGYLLRVGDVDDLGGTALGEFPFGRSGGNVSAHHVSVAVDTAQLHNQFGSDLAGASDHKYILHC